jgi:Protein of unknown function (DUF3048) N-terminal domain/Protein of unknown function (DUF3048) C-terminal domain
VTWNRRTIVITASAIIAAAALVVAGVVILRGSSKPVQPVASASSAPAAPTLSPFTGERTGALGPVLAVKIDNVVQARPPTGLADADIVYILPVEGGLSRIMAIFSSHFPRVIGPVRSAREDDIELLQQFGRPAFAYSGAQSHLLPVVHQASIVDLYAGIVGGYFRDPNRLAPHNLYANTAQLLAEARGASNARDIGFRFGPPPPGGRPTAAYSTAYPAASFTFTWSASKERWLVSMDGSPAATTDDGQLAAATVVIQYTTVRTSRFNEQGVPPPYAESTGSGTAVVLRNGRAYDARWSRPQADGGTSFTTASGQPMTFATGPVWIVLTAAK